MLNANVDISATNMPHTAFLGLSGISQGCDDLNTSQAWRERMHVGVHPMSEEHFYINTAPGAMPGDPFNPPKQWEGDQSAYRQLMYDRWNGMWGQRLRFAIRSAATKTLVIEGPYADAAASVLNHFLGYPPKLQRSAA